MTSLEKFWNESASQSVIDDYRAGRVKTVHAGRDESSVPVYDNGELVGHFCYTWLGGDEKTRVFIPSK